MERCFLCEKPTKREQGFRSYTIQFEGKTHEVCRRPKCASDIEQMINLGAQKQDGPFHAPGKKTDLN